MESFILDQDDLEDGEHDLDTSKFLLSSENMEGADLRSVDPETQARLEALLEAAGKKKDHRVITDYLTLMLLVVANFVNTK